MNAKKLNRKIHYWGALACAVPVAIIIVTGCMLLLKKEIAWVQPPSMSAPRDIPTLDFGEILPLLANIEEVAITQWSQIKRIDVRPTKGILKVQVKGNWEIQMDHNSGEILSVAYRRSGVIEAIHDGSYFHDYAKLGLFLPAAIILLVLWITGIYLFIMTELTKLSSKKKRLLKRSKPTGEFGVS